MTDGVTDASVFDMASTFSAQVSPDVRDPPCPSSQGQICSRELRTVGRDFFKDDV